MSPHLYTAQRIWQEAQKLPPIPCAVLLLSLRCQVGSAWLIEMPRAGIATLDQIAMATGLRSTQLLWLWNELPANEATIGRLLGLSRVQVIEIRQKTYAWLQRQLSDPDFDSGSA